MSINFPFDGGSNIVGGSNISISTYSGFTSSNYLNSNYYNKTSIDSIIATTSNSILSNINTLTFTADTSSLSNILNNKIDSNYISNTFTISNLSNLIYDANYTVERPYPPKLYNSSTQQNIITNYLGQSPVYYESISLNGDLINYGIGNYEIYSSSIDTTTTISYITFTGTGNAVYDVFGNTNYNYISFINNGSLTLNTNIICDILIVGGGGSGAARHAGGGGAGAVIYLTNQTLSAGTYDIIIGSGGNSVISGNGNNGNDTSIKKNTTIIYLAKGGGGGAGTNGIAGGSSGGTTGGSQNISLAPLTTNIPSGTYGNYGGKGSPTGDALVYSGGGGGGAGSNGTDANQTAINGLGGNGGIGLNLNITGTNTYYGGGGGGGISYNGNTQGSGGLGGGGAGSKGAVKATNGIANTGGGGGGSGFNGISNGESGSGGSGIVIIRFIKIASSTKKELFNKTINDEGCTFKKTQYNSTSGNYLTTDRFINNYYGDWIIIKLINPIFLTKYRIYNRLNAVARAPSLFKLFGSIDGSTYEEILNASNNTTPLDSSNYSLGYYEKIVINNYTKFYLYIGLVVNKIIGGDDNLNFTEFEIHGKEIIYYTPMYNTSNNLINLINAKQNILTSTTQLIGIGTQISNLQTSNINGILDVSKGGIGTSILSSGSILFGNGSSPVSTHNNLSYNSTTSTLNITGNIITSNISIGTTNPISNLTIQGTSLFNGIASFSNSIYQSNATTFNILMGNVGIGTSINLNSNLTIQGTSEFKNSITQTNISTSNYFMGKVGIGTTNAITNLTVKSSYSDENTGICIDANDIANYSPSKYNLKIYPYIQGLSQVGYKFKVNNVSSSTESLIIGYNGNIGIANTNPITPLHIGNSESTSTINDGSLTISKNNGSGIRRNFNFSYSNINDDFIIGDYGIGSTSLTKINQLIIQSGAYSNTLRLNASGDIDLVYDTSSAATRRYANIGGLRLGGWDANTIYNNTSNLGLSSCNSITFNTGSSLSQRMLIDTSGNIGIGKTIPNCKLDVSAGLTTANTVFTMRLASGAFSDNGGFGTLLGLATESNGWSKCAIGHQRTGSWDTGDIVFLNRKSADTTSCSMSTDVQMRIYSGGGVNITQNLTIGSNIICGSNIISSNFIGDGSLLTNLKLENQTNYIYPPLALISSNNTITTSQYANGIYTISASSFATGKESYYCFNGSLITNDWSPSSASYTGGSGAYSGSTYSTTVSGTIYNGEWIQIQYDKGFAANSFTITGIAGNNTSCPSNFILVGSIDAKNWILLSSQSGIIGYDTIPSKTFSIYNYTSYNYYRLVITKTVSATSLSIAEISFTGTQNTSFTNVDNFNNIIYNTNEKQFPPRLYDGSASAETTTSTEIYNCAPVAVYKQTFTVNNHGTYTIYSSSVFGSAYKNFLFDYNSTGGGHWNIYYTGTSFTYSATAGTYNGGNTYYIVNNYFGDWIILKLPFKIVLTRFRFYSRTGYISRSPGLWKCYGSNDGITFIEIIDASNTITSLTSSDYATNGYYEKQLPSYFDIPYQYIGWTVNKLAGGDSWAYVLNFEELQIFGKDDISNSYSNVWNKSGINIYNTLGSVGIGTSTNLNSNLTIQGTSLFNGLASFSNSIYQLNATTSNILMGNLGIANSSPKLNLDIGNTNANHKIGRAILTAGNIHNADKLDFLSIGRWDGSSTADWQFTGIKYGVINGAAAGEGLGFDNHSCITFYTWGRLIAYEREVMRLTSRGRLGINTSLPTELLDVNGNINCSGNTTLNTSNPILTIKGNTDNQKSTIFLGTPFTSTSALKTAIIAEGIGSWSRSKLHFCLNNTGDVIPPPTPNWNDITYNATVADAKMTIIPSGNIGIANTIPISLLQIGTSVSNSIINDGSLTISKNNGSGIRRNFNFSYNSTNDDFIMGDYGYGDSSLTKVNQLIIQSGAYSNTLRLNASGDIDLVYDTSSTETKRYANIGGLRLGGWDSNTIYNNNDILGLSTCNSITFNTGSSLQQRMIIDTSGNVGIGSGIPRQKLDINGNIKSDFIFSDALYLNNIKLENQTIYTFPPQGISTSPATFHTSLYGNGTYTISASSSAISKDPYLCFNGDSTDEWTPSSASYTGGSGAYMTASPTYSTVVSGTIYNGEWIQLQYVRGFAATSMTLTGITTSNLKCPSNFVVAGSIDSSNWVLLASNAEIIGYDISPTKTFNIYNNTSYYYYRIIVTKTVGDSNLSISDISFNGTQNTSFTNTDTFNNILYNTLEKQFLPTYNSLTSQVISFNEIFNCVPLNPYKQTLTYNIQGLYTIYSSSTYDTSNNYTKELLFNSSTTDGIAAHWKSDNYISTGEISGINTNYIKPDYLGDWIIIKLPFKIILTRFIFYQRASTPYRAPARWKCYGSNDGVNFTEIIEASNTGIDATYSGNATTKTLSSLFDIPYLYIGWTFNKILGIDPYATVLNFTEIRFYGKDDISHTWDKYGTNIHFSTGNVGIGTASPYQRLDVAGNVKADFLISDGSYLNNLKLENQSINLYPPTGLGNSSATWVNSTYGNGNYTASASTTLSTNYPYRCFNRNYADEWSSSALYSGTSNVYAGAISTIVSGSNYLGEWVQLQYARGFALTSMTLYGIAASNLKCPKDFIIAGSLDSSNWVLLSSQSNITGYDTIPSKTFNIYNNTLYYYYRLIVTKTVGDSNLSICDLLLYGTQNTKFTSLDNFNNISYNTYEKQFPPKVYNYASTTATQTANEVFNCLPLNPFKEIIYIDNSIYTIYSSTYSTLKSLLFDNINSNIAKWAATQYASGTGIYNSGNNYYIAGNTTNKGEWLIIEFPFKIILTAFKFYQDSANPNTAPGLWKCYGSNDGITFIEITDASNTITVATYSGYTYTKIIPSIFNLPFLFIGWVFYQLAGATGTYLSIAELQIFGRQDNSTSILNIQDVIKINTNNEQRFPPSVYDSASANETQVANELFNCSPLSPYKQSLIINNDGQYDIYYSSSYNVATSKIYLFNNVIESINTTHWGISNYNNANGTVSIINTNFIFDSNYKGDWIVVKFPYKISLTAFGFYQRIGFATRSPGKWKCYGSNDGINWFEIINASNTINLAIYSNYLYSQRLKQQSIEYLYIGWVINQLSGNDSLLNFVELYIYGKSIMKPIGTNNTLNSILNINSSTLFTDSIYQSNSLTPNYFLGNVGIGITNPFATLSIGNPDLSNPYSDGTLSISKRISNGVRNFKLGIDDTMNFCIGDFGNGVSDNTWNSKQFNINWNTGNIGIGTANHSSNLAVQGSSFHFGIASFSNSIYQSNITTSNIIMGNVSLGTVGISTHKLDVAGNVNATSFSGSGSNITNINYNNIYNPPTITVNLSDYSTTSQMSSAISNSQNISSNYTEYISNILNTKIDNKFTDERKYPPKLYNSSSSQSIISNYLGQNNVYYETITLNTDNINYGIGTYEIYSSSIDDSNISFFGTNSSSNIASDYVNIIFPKNGTLTLNYSIKCDILIVGGGGQGGCTDAGGGGAGGLVFMPNFLLNAGTYNVTVGTGGIDDGNTISTTGANGNDTIIKNSDNSIFLIAKGGGGGGSRFNATSPAASGGSGGGAGSGTNGSASGGNATQTNSSIVSGNSLTYGFGNNGGTNATNSKGGSGGGGAGTAGGNNTSGQGGDGLSSVVINGIIYNFKNIFNLTTNTSSPNYVGKVENDGNIYFAAGGGGGHNTVTRNGGLGGGGRGYESNSGENAALTNTGSGGGGGGGNHGQGGRGSDGVVIIRFLKSETKKELFNKIIDDAGCMFKTLNYNSTSNYYSGGLDRYINNYNGDWIIIKLPKAIILTKFRFVHRTSYVSQAPSLWRCYGSNDGINFTEITEAFNDIVANALTSTSYNANKIYEKSLNETFKTSYQYIGFTFNKTISNEYLCFAELQLFGKELYNFQSELAAIALGTNSSNYASNISNVIIINSSNFTSGTGTNTSNYASNISNVIITNSSNFTSGTGTNTSNYASNISNIIITNNSNFTLGTGTNTSNYASNISNVIIINNSNFTLGTGTNTSNYASNVSNVIINSLNTNINNTSNYASNVSNVIIRNTSNYASNISNVIITNTSNYASNVSNVIITDINNNYLKLSGGTLSGNLNVSANITTQQLYINNQNLTASIFFSPNSSIYSIFSRKVPWAMYFAEDYNASSPNVLPNYISNGKDATLSGIEVIKTTTSGNGATGPITFISGTTGSTVLFPIGSIPSTFTILSLTRYTGPNKQRILDGSAPPSYYWLHGHWQGISGSAKRGKAYYHAWITDESSSEGNIDDWLCMIGKNSGAAPGNILVDGIGKTTKTGGSGGNNFRLNINSVITNEKSDWALSCVMIWSEALTDAEMVDLNTIINNYKNDGISIKSLINSTVDDDSVIESRVYNSSEKTELLLFKGNDVTGAANGPDRIRLKAGNIAFDTYSTITSSSSRNDENIVMLINENGYVGIGTTNPSQILQVGAGGRLRISNGASDYSLIGTIDTEGVTNTRIILSGNTRTSSPFAGDIQYYATTAIGEHLFYVNETNILTLSSTTMTTSSNIDCGGGIAITGSTAFNQQSLVESSNQTNTYINFKSAGSGNDWCYLRQIGTSENYKLALDFHDDIDARFCIRSITSTSNTDVINEVFTVDNGNTIINGLVNIYTGTRYAVINNKMQPGSLTIGGIDVNYGGGVSQWTTTNVAGLLMECLNNTEIAVHDAGERVASLMYYEGNTTNRITIGRDMGWGAISNVNINGILQIGGTNINNYLFNNNGVSHLSFNNFDNIDKFGYTFIVGSTNGPGTDTQYYSWYIGLGSDYSSFSGTKSFGMQFAIGRYEDFPKLSVRRKQVGNWTSWQGLTAERAVELTSGNKTITGNLTVSSILTTSSNINCGGGIAITGSTAIHDTCNINLENMQSTYISFAPSTSVDDFCYLRQIGTSDNYKLAFDFHDNIDARFCIRSITSTNTPDTITEVFTVDNGNVTCTGNIDCGGGIAITGSTAFNQATLVDTGNKANTYINFKSADGGSDWCYLRQIGTGEYKLALDFHDDGNDARFCIRNVLSYVPGSDTVSEVFAIDNGIVSCSSNINTTNKLICNNTQVAAPAQGIFGGNGDRIILYPGTASAHPYSFGINASELWYRTPPGASHKFYINETAYLTVNNTGATVNGSLNASSLQESGKNISTIYDKITDRQLSINNLANTYVSSNQLYNYTYTYSSAQVYPPKLYNSASVETITTYLSQSVYYQVMQLDTTGITYGSGTYEIYSSSSFDGVNTHNKGLLFNNTDEALTAAWKNNNYDTSNGTYIISNGKNINGYYGDWIIIKLPVSIILTSFRFYATFIYGTEKRSPGEWKCYGSVDGITYTEITEGSQMTRLVSSDYTTNGYYEKTLTPVIDTPYQYIGWVINKIVATSGQAFLHFSELKIYGKQVQPLLINDKYLSSNVLPNIQKKNGFQITCSTPITLNGTTYYKYDIDLTKYTQNSTLSDGTSSYRIFNINCFIASGYFNLLSNNLPRVFNYNVYMSNKTAAGDGPAGINICATGTPENFNLDKIPSNYVFLLRTNNYNYLSVVTTQSGVSVNCIIMDNLN